MYKRQSYAGGYLLLSENSIQSCPIGDNTVIRDILTVHRSDHVGTHDGDAFTSKCLTGRSYRANEDNYFRNRLRRSVERNSDRPAP